MSQFITISSSVDVFPGCPRKIDIKLCLVGAEVCVTSMDDTEDLTVRFSWETMQDPMELAKAFSMERVCVFVEAVEQLGKAHLNKAAYLALMEMDQ